MSEEEKKAIRDLKDNIEYARKCGREDTYTNQETIYIILNLIQKQQEEIKTLETTLQGYQGLSTVIDIKQEEIDSLKDIKEIVESKVTDLRKIKQVDNLKSENWILEQEAKKQDKIIDLMAEFINNIDTDEDICKEMCIFKNCEIEEHEYCKKCIKQYFEKKASDEGAKNI